MRNANRSGPKLMDWDIASSDKLTYQLHPFYGALVNSTDAYLLFADAVKRDNLRFNWH